MSFNKEKYLEIRSRAKELLERRGRTDMPEDWKDITKLFEELEVSQIELELQNDELLRYQQELIESRNRYSNLYDLAPIGYVTLDAESRVVEMNLTGATMFGLDRGSMTGKPLTRFIAPESQDTFYLKVRAIIENRTKNSFEISIKVSDGSELPVQVQGLSGAENRVRLALMDISERQQMEQALRSSEQKLRNLFMSIRDTIIIADQNRRILDANQPALRDMFGYETNEVAGWETSMLYADTSGFSHAGQEVFNPENRGAGKLLEIDFRRKDGSVFPAELFALKLLDEQGKVIGNLGIIRDISEKNETLTKLREALEDKDMLNREIHHRVKNNLIVIQSLLRLQSVKAETQDTKDALAVSENRLKVMSLIHDMLHRQASMKEIAFSDYLGSLTRAIRSAYSLETRRINLLVSSESVFLDVDQAIPLALIVNELVTNSIKHAFDVNDANGGEIRVFLSHVQNNEYKVAVGDTGRGLPADFNSVETDGLGMSIVSTLVKQLDADLSFFSKEGTTFEIKFNASNMDFK